MAARSGAAQIICDDRQVGLGKIEPDEFGGGDPAEGGVFVRLRFAAPGGEADDEGNQLHGDRRVGVGVRDERTEDVHGGAELLAQFAVQRGLGGFAGLDLASGELPFAAEVFVRGPLGHEHAAVAFDEGADDEERSF